MIWGCLLVAIAIMVLIYMRASARVWQLALLYMLLLVSLPLGWTPFLGLLWIVGLIPIALLQFSRLRQIVLWRPLIKRFAKAMPTLSATEQIAIEAGSTGWEASLYQGSIDYKRLLALPHASLTEAEQAFIDGPVNQLCAMVDRWGIDHHQFVIPASIMDFLRKQRFFGLMITEEFGGLGFTPLAHAAVIRRLASVHAALASLVSVPNSLGPGELLLRYGTTDQQQYYLPRLATGEDIPCFALTSVNGGSDAGAMIDYGVVCQAAIEGERKLAIRLNWSKRYITLAPIATLIGLAFKLYDPDHLLGDQEELGISCALITANTQGISIGRHHNPFTAVFPNGPIQGKDVLIPLENLIGGAQMVGQGWKMLMECLADGRAISLPATATGVAQQCALVSSAYARIRRQFNAPLAAFGGIIQELGQQVGLSYLMQMTHNFSLSRLQDNEKSAVAAGICKYHITELGRKVLIKAMDIHAGKAICMGPKNYLAEFYMLAPISITVEGANILTRSMMIYGQGLMRCHPFLHDELRCFNKLSKDPGIIKQLDKLLAKHISFSASNMLRCLWYGLTNSRCVLLPDMNSICSKQSMREMQRFSSIFASLSDMLLLIYGAKLKRQEQINARMADMHSYLYMFTALVHQQHAIVDKAHQPLVAWCCDYLLYQLQQAALGVIENIPGGIGKRLLKAWMFPLGARHSAASDQRTEEIAALLQEPGAVKDWFSGSCCVEPTQYHAAGQMIAALPQLIAIEPLLMKLRKALKAGEISGLSVFDQVQDALSKQLISGAEAEQIDAAETLRQQLLAVDDFSFAEYVPSLRPEQAPGAASDASAGDERLG